jgi:nucleotide-binding universal stress UspA family protein
MAGEWVERGRELASKAGFQAEGRLEEGKPWRVICRVAEDLVADAIVLGARGLGRIEAALLGGVSSAVVLHAKRPVLLVPHQRNAQRVVSSA